MGGALVRLLHNDRLLHEASNLDATALWVYTAGIAMLVIVLWLT